MEALGPINLWRIQVHPKLAGTYFDAATKLGLDPKRYLPGETYKGHKGQELTVGEGMNVVEVPLRTIEDGRAFFNKQKTLQEEA